MAKVTIGGLRRIIREELEKVIRENEDNLGEGEDHENDESEDEDEDEM